MAKPLLQKNGTETTGQQHAKTSKINLDMDLISFTKKKKKPQMDHRPKSKSQNHKTIHLLYVEDNIEKNLGDPGYTGGFFGIVQHQGHEKTSLINWN